MSNILYTIAMNSLGQLLRSRARVEILRALHHQPDAVGLRHLARLAGVHPHSVEVALASLLKEKLVMCKRTSNRPLYGMNRAHPDAFTLAAVFSAAARAQVMIRNRTLNDRARTMLSFSGEANRMIAHARRSRRVT